jgi:indolepyruvate ferredoxin oxidoreductase alpha subunit
LNAIDSTICMGASIGTAIGMEKARGREFARHLVAIIGDSTFIHSGITGLVDVVYNRASTTVIILDNRTTGMTGHQDNPVTGKTLQGDAVRELDLPALCRAVGIERVTTIDPFDLAGLETVLQEELAADEPSVIITRRVCALLEKEALPPFMIDEDKCTRCARCMRLGCPCLVRNGKIISINASQCTGCGLCASVCQDNAIVKVGENHA